MRVALPEGWLGGLVELCSHDDLNLVPTFVEGASDLFGKENLSNIDEVFPAAVQAQEDVDPASVP